MNMSQEVDSTPSFSSRELGSTGFRVGPLGIGNGSLGITVDAQSEGEKDGIAIEALRTAVRAGITYVDTCPQYRDGASDRRVGAALGDGWRQRVVLGAKVGTHPARPNDFSYEGTRWTVERDLESLATDHLDVVLFHDPHEMKEIMRPGGGLDALEQLKVDGVVGAIGLAVQNHGFQRVAIESGRFDVLLMPYDYNLIRTTASSNLDLAAAAGLGCIVASPFQQGLLAGDHPDEANRVRKVTASWLAREGDLARARMLWAWALEREIDIRALAVQFCMREPRIATTLVGPRSAVEISEVIQSATAPIAEEHWKALDELLPTLPPPSPGGEAATGPHPPVI